MTSRPVTRRRIKLVRIEGAESWLVYQKDRDPLGPVSTELVARAIQSGTIPLDAYLTVVGASHWRRALDIPAVQDAIEALRDEDKAKGRG